MTEVPIALQETPPAGMPSISIQDLEQLQTEYLELQEKTQALEGRIRKSEERRRAFMHILSDLKAMNRKLNDQRKAMIHILADYEQDRRRLEKQTERLDNSRRALMHILQDSYQSNLRLENSRKAMIHIMSDLRETTEEVKQREHELREKQEQLVQAGKLATLGELTTGIAHELNNPLNNIGLFVGNAMDLIKLGSTDTDPDIVLRELASTMQQVRKATEIITHLRTFGRAAPVSYEPVSLSQVIKSAISLVQEQLRLRQIEVTIHMPAEDIVIIGNAIQLEQVFLNILTNARDALINVSEKSIAITCTVHAEDIAIRVHDTGPGIPPEIAQRIFDPFFTTKEVGAGTGLGLSITYSILQEHQGTITLEHHQGRGALFLITLPRPREVREKELTHE